jgi:hypothetical protein
MGFMKRKVKITKRKYDSVDRKFTIISNCAILYHNDMSLSIFSQDLYLVAYREQYL